MKKRGILCVVAFIVATYYFYNSKKIKVNAIPFSQASLNFKQPKIELKKVIAPMQSKNSSKKISNPKKPSESYSYESTYCLLKNLPTSIPLEGDIQIRFSLKYMGEGEYEKTILVRSSDCPTDTFSVVKIANSSISKQINCLDTNFEELLPYAKKQLSIDEVPAKINEYNLALNGAGQFLIFCPNDGFYLTRRGEFIRDPITTFITNKEGCLLWSDANQKIKRGFPIATSDPFANFNEYGCLPSGSTGTGFRCLAILNYDDQSIKNLKYDGSDRIKVEIEGHLLSRNKAQVFSDSLENFSESENALVGINSWENIPYLEKPINCQN